MNDPVKNVFGAVDYAIFILMLAISAGIGLNYGFINRKKNDTQEFLMGSRSLSVFPVAMSVFTSFMSAVSLLGIPAETYRFGTQYVMVNIAFFLVIPCTAYLYLPVYYNLGITSAYEYLELRFNRTVRTIGAIIFWLQTMPFMSIALYAPALAFAEVTDTNVWFCVLSVGLVCTFYTSFGGMRAVVWTDLFQSLLMYAAILLIVIKGTLDIGGIDVVWNRSVEGERIEFFNFSLIPTVRHTFWSLVIGGFITWMGIFAANQSMIQRYLTIGTLENARKCIWINLPALISLNVICCLAGLVMYAYYSTCDPIGVKMVDAPDQLLPHFVIETIKGFPGFPGLFMSGIFSAAISSISSGLNSLAAVTYEDIIKTYITSTMTEVWATRVTKCLALSYGLLCILLVLVAERLGSILQAAIAISGIISGPMLGLFTLGMFFPWSNSIGAFIGLFSGFITSTWIGIGAFVQKPFNPEAMRSYNSCIELYYNVTGIIATTPIYLTPSLHDNEIFPLYRLSYIWMSTVGFIITVIIGIVVSLLSGCPSYQDVDVKLLSPIVPLVKQLLTKKRNMKCEENGNKDETRF